MKLPVSARGVRYDRAIREALEALGRTASTREIRRALESGDILVEGRRRAPGQEAAGGESVELDAFVPRAEARLQPDPELLARVEVLFEDPRLLVLDKPSGVPTQPLGPKESGCLVHAAVAAAPEIADAGPALEGGLVHRLDVGTSGVVMFAKDAEQRDALRAAMSRHEIEKTYLALVYASEPIHDTAEARGAIGPAGRPDRVEVLAPDDPAGQAARTLVEVQARLEAGHAWVRARTRYGRRHQVRAHLAGLGAPIVGDPIYGAGPTAWLDRLALHASQVRLPDGRAFEAPVPPELVAALEHLRGAAR